MQTDAHRRAQNVRSPARWAKKRGAAQRIFAAWMEVLLCACVALPACTNGESNPVTGDPEGEVAGGGSHSGGSSGSSSNTAGSKSGGSTAYAGATSGVAGASGADSSSGAGPGGTGGSVAGSSGVGGAGTAGTSTSGGSGPVGGSGGVYNPCPAGGEVCSVMPLGDSITDGYKSSTGAGYRLELFRFSIDNSKKLTFVGSHESGPSTVENVPFPKKQEGHSGWTIADIGGRSGLQEQIIGWLKAPQPHVIALMIGTNDIGIDAAGAPTRLAKLLDTITTTAPNALVVLAQIVPTTDDNMNQKVRTYNAAMPSLVKVRADAGKHLILVDQYSAFTQNPDWKKAYMADGLHPNDVGYGVMAKTWWSAISALLASK